MPPKSYYSTINKNLKARLKQQRKDDRDAKRAALALAKKLKKEQSAALKQMKRQGIEERHKKAFAKTREKRLKKLGLLQSKEKSKEGTIFHLSKAKYKRKKKGGLFSSRGTGIKYSWGSKPKKRGGKKRSTLSRLLWG